MTAAAGAARTRSEHPQLARSHIIARPRLTHLLDHAPARIIILVAPAGYGKTTLAQQWIATKHHSWYQGTGASRDVASLAVGLAEAVVGHGSPEAQRVRGRAAIATPEAVDVEALADVVRAVIPDAQRETILAIDDYDAIAASSDAEELVWQLASTTELRFLITARARPAWATARRLLYGEIFELSQETLAMDPEEATRVLARRPGTTLPGLAALARGWPAVLGLAALTGDVPPPDGLPDDLYEFFAEELYQQVPPSLREPLMKLAFVDALDDEVVALLVGGDGHAVVEVGEHIGFLSRGPASTYVAHPLVRTFLEKKALVAAAFDREIGRAIAASLIEAGRWDDAFAVIERFRLPSLLDDLIEVALPEMIRTGRLTTLERWAELGKQYGGSASTALASAEVALRRSAHTAAETMAVRAAEALDEANPLHARALMIAGNAAHLVDDEEAGFAYHSRARAAARTEEHRRQATWGQLICANQLDLPVVESLVAELEQQEHRSPEDGLRLATMRGVIDLRGCGIVRALPVLHRAYALVAEANDPLARTSFLNVYSRCLGLGGFYEEASAMAQQLIDDARDNRLDFVVPHALVAKGIAEAGARRPAAALRLADEAEDLARGMRDVHNEIDARSLRCRVAVTLGRHDKALDATAHEPDGAGPGARSEYLLSRAIALVGAGRVQDARQLRTAALAASGRSGKAHEVRNLSRWVAAIAAAVTGNATPTVARALRESVATGVIDGFVVAYRGFPSVLKAVAEDGRAVQDALPLLDRVGDRQQALAAGFATTAPFEGTLSKREAEVYELLAAGRTNRAIAEALFISEVTVKVHVRHILQKLGAKTRTEAVALGATTRPQ